MKPWSRLDWLIILIFVALVALFYWRVLTPNLADRQSFPPGDFHAQFWAFATFEVRELSAGRLPLWNPYTFAGAPFWADVQAAVFYPPSLLTLILSAPWGFSLFALEIEAIVHFWLAALFMYLFVRQLTQSRAAATISALTFTFSGYLTGYPSQQLAVLEADIWLPLILFFLYKAYNDTAYNPPTSPPPHLPTWAGSFRPSPHSPTHQPANRFLLLAGLAWAMTLLAGHPQSALIVAYISLAYLIFLQFRGSQGSNRLKPRLPSQNRLKPRLLSHLSHFTSYVLRLTSYVLRFTLHASLFLLTGLGLAAIQFIPAVEYTLLSVRAEGTYDNMAGGFPITDIIQFLLPGQVSFYSPLYIGAVALMLALAAIFIQPHRHTIFWAIVAFVALLISFGGNSFLYTPLYLFTPGFSIFRGQERWAFATAFSLSILAGYGLKQLYHPLPATHYVLRTTHHARRPMHYVSRLTQYLLLLALLLTFLFFYGLNDTGWKPDNPFYGLLAASTLLTILLSLAWLLWRFWPYLHPALAAGLTAALICFDLFSVNWQTNLYPQQPEWHTQMPAIVTAIKSDAAHWPDQPYRVYNEFRLYDNYGVPFEIEDLWGASPLRPRRYDQFLAPPMPSERTWELLNVKYVITWRETLYLPSTIIYQEPASDGTTYVHRLNVETPRAWLAIRAEIVDDAAMLQKIADPAFDRWRVALFEPGTALDPAFLDETESTAAEPNAFQIARSVRHAVQHTYQINTPAPALLVMSETYYPGWQATIDGRPAPILRANYVLRAIPVPAGQHTIQILFRPFSFTIGAIISALTVAALIAIFVLQRVRALKRQPQPMSYEPQSQDAAAGS